MFSERDVRDITRLIPPNKLNDTTPHSLHPLVLSSTGQGFITGESVLNDFERRMTDGTEPLSISVISNDMNVHAETTLHLVRSCPNLALLSEDELSVIPKGMRDSKERLLHELLATQLVSKAAFSRENNVSRNSIDQLVQDDATRSVGEIQEVNDRLLANAYQQRISTMVREQLERSLRDGEPVDILPTSLLGTPPVWYLRQVVEGLIQAMAIASQIHLDEGPEKIQCTPTQSIVQKRDALISELQSGRTPYLNISTFAQDFKVLYSSYQEAATYINTLPSISVDINMALSEAWISTLADRCNQILQRDGFVDPMKEMPSDLDLPIQLGIMEDVNERIVELYSTKPDSVREAGNIVLTSSRYQIEREKLLERVKTHAISQWQAFKDGSKELRYQWSDVLDTIPMDQSVTRSLALDDSIESPISECFWQQIADAESDNEKQFSAFWVERVLSRTLNYTEALKSVEDVKLRDQLADTLSSYLQKELLPDTISKAGSQGFLASRTTQKNVQRFESSVKVGKLDLTSTISSLVKFGKKQDIKGPDPALLQETKESLIRDMARRMQKPKTEGPLLFLTLVIVLFSKHYPGLIYATGKFAPKLLKQLKPKLSSEDYELLENWKEHAKAGTLGSNDKEAMGKMAEMS